MKRVSAGPLATSATTLIFRACQYTLDAAARYRMDVGNGARLRCCAAQSFTPPTPTKHKENHPEADAIAAIPVLSKILTMVIGPINPIKK
jgi:hypothetical protein